MFVGRERGLNDLITRCCEVAKDKRALEFWIVREVLESSRVKYAFDCDYVSPVYMTESSAIVYIALIYVSLRALQLLAVTSGKIHEQHEAASCSCFQRPPPLPPGNNPEFFYYGTFYDDDARKKHNIAFILEDVLASRRLAG